VARRLGPQLDKEVPAPRLVEPASLGTTTLSTVGDLGRGGVE